MIIEILLILINIIGFATIALDKYKAIQHKWRISENTLFLLAMIGGSAGVFVGMIIFRHKTKHLKFMVGVPVIIALQVLLAWKFRNTLLLLIDFSMIYI
jgi:uncharacterized membrane protein YsdA (DUF1294 family)